jgi:hypothetical protein
MRSATVLLLAMVMVSCQSRPLSDVGTPLPTETAPALARTPRPPSVGTGDGGTPVGEDARATPQPATVTVVSSALVSPAPTKDSGYGFKRARVEGERPIPPADATTTGLQSGAGGVLSTPSTNAGSTPAPSATPTPIVRASSQAPVRAAIEASVWPAQYHDKLEAVIACESSGSTEALSAGGHVGLLQVDPALHGPVPAGAVAQLDDAYEVFLKQGWGAWSCS